MTLPEKFVVYFFSRHTRSVEKQLSDWFSLNCKYIRSHCLRFGGFFYFIFLEKHTCAFSLTPCCHVFFYPLNENVRFRRQQQRAANTSPEKLIHSFCYMTPYIVSGLKMDGKNYIRHQTFIITVRNKYMNCVSGLSDTWPS